MAVAHNCKAGFYSRSRVSMRSQTLKTTTGNFILPALLPPCTLPPSSVTHQNLFLSLFILCCFKSELNFLHPFIPSNPIPRIQHITKLFVNWALHFLALAEVWMILSGRRWTGEGSWWLIRQTWILSPLVKIPHPVLGFPGLTFPNKAQGWTWTGNGVRTQVNCHFSRFQTNCWRDFITGLWENAHSD